MHECLETCKPSKAEASEMLEVGLCVLPCSIKLTGKTTKTFEKAIDAATLNEARLSMKIQTTAGRETECRSRGKTYVGTGGRRRLRSSKRNTC